MEGLLVVVAHFDKDTKQRLIVANILGGKTKPEGCEMNGLGCFQFLNC